MPKFINRDVFISVNGVDLSNWAFGIDTPSEKEQIDVSGFNPQFTKEFLPGTKEDSVTVSFLQDFAVGGPHATLFPIYDGDLEVFIRVRPTSAAAAATNPELQGNVTLTSYNGLSGEINARSEFTATFVPSDEDGITWSATS
jgi:hypothetical protein